MDELFQQLPGRLERLSERLTQTAEPVDPEVLRRRGGRSRRRRLVAGAVAAAALLVVVAAGVGRVSGLLPVPSTGVTAQPQLRSVRLAATAAGGGPADAAGLAEAARILRARLQAVGVDDATVTERDGGLLVAIPPPRWREDLTPLLTAPGRLELRPVIAVADATDPSRPFSTVACTADPPLPPPGERAVVCVRPDGADDAAGADTKLLLGPAAAGNEAVGSARPMTTNTLSLSGGGDWEVDVLLTGRGERALQELTAAAACQPAGSAARQVAVVLDGSVVFHAPIAEAVGCGQGIFGGTIAITRLTERQAGRQAALVSGSPLPVRLEPRA
jgi:SecD/SecF fusion protein